MVKKDFLTKQSKTDKWLDEERRSLNYPLKKVEHELKITKEVMDSIDPYDIRSEVKIKCDSFYNFAHVYMRDLMI